MPAGNLATTFPYRNTTRMCCESFTLTRYGSKNSERSLSRTHPLAPLGRIGSATRTQPGRRSITRKTRGAPIEFGLAKRSFIRLMSYTAMVRFAATATSRVPAGVFQPLPLGVGCAVAVGADVAGVGVGVEEERL